jgi:hypothetical protein
MDTMTIIAILAASVAAQILGGLWYSQSVFGKMWTKEMKFTKAKLAKVDMKTPIVVMFLTNIVTATILWWLQLATSAGTIGKALSLGLAVWIGFTATVQLGGVLWEMKTLKWYAINAGHSLVSLLLMSAILFYL